MVSFRITSQPDVREDSKKTNYNWSLLASNGQVIMGHNQGHAKATQMVNVIMKHLVRGDETYRKALVQALAKHGLDETGKSIKKQKE